MKCILREKYQPIRQDLECSYDSECINANASEMTLKARTMMSLLAALAPGCSPLVSLALEVGEMGARCAPSGP